MEAQTRRELSGRMFLVGLFTLLGAIYFYKEAEWGLSDPVFWRVLNSLGLAAPIGIVGFYLTPGRFFQSLPKGKPAPRNPSNLVVYRGRDFENCCCALSCFGCLSFLLAVLVYWVSALLEAVWQDGQWFLLGMLAFGFWVGCLRRHWLEVDRAGNRLFRHLTLGGMQISRPDPEGLTLKGVGIRHFKPKDGSATFSVFLIFSNGWVQPMSDEKMLATCHRQARQLSLAYQVPYLKDVVARDESPRVAKDFLTGSKQFNVHGDWGPSLLPETTPQEYGSPPPIE